MPSEQSENGNKPKRLKASEWTTTGKQPSFKAYLSAYSCIINKMQHKPENQWMGRWLYFELTAGSGLIDCNGEEPIAGSPLIALRAFRAERGLEIHCLFVEWNPAYFQELKRVVEDEYSSWTDEERQRVTYQIQCRDHREVLRELMYRCRYKMALVYWDGLGGDVYPTQELRQWLERNGRHDLLIMASGTAQKRMGRPRLDQLLEMRPAGCKVCLTRINDKWEWIFALMTRWPPLGNKLTGKDSLRFYDVDSATGKDILDTLGTTKKERETRHQPELWQ